MKKILQIFIAFSLIILQSSAKAVTSISTLTKEVTLPERTPVVTFGYVMQVFFSFLIVAGMIYLTSKYILPKMQVSSKGKLIEVVDRIGLEPQVSAFVLRVKSQSWLVVSSNKNIQLISEIKESKET